jgi:hypothetical protein
MNACEAAEHLITHVASPFEFAAPAQNEISGRNNIPGCLPFIGVEMSGGGPVKVGSRCAPAWSGPSFRVGN